MKTVQTGEPEIILSKFWLLCFNATFRLESPMIRKIRLTMEICAV